jgi:alpha-1,2-mannosyltransferase
MRSEGLRVLLLRAAYAIALIGAVAIVYLILAGYTRSGNLGFDYKAYDLAVDHLLAGQTMYDPNATETGGFGLFFYPPPFAVMVIPFALLPTELGVALWTGFLLAATLLAIWLMPVSGRVRLIVLLLAALSWPLVYAIALGQVGPLILLTFAAGWRWLDRPARLGLSTAVGGAIKIQPAILVGWAVLTRRWRAAVIAIVVGVAMAAIATVIAGPSSWFEEASLLGRVSKPVLTPHAFGVGRLLYEAGVPESTAMLAHLANLALVAAVTLFATLRAAPVASYLAVVVASQFISPVLWDHYALVLLLPVAWLLEQRRWWAALIPLLTPTLFVILQVQTTGWLYPIAFWAALLAVTFVGSAAGTTTSPDSAGGATTSEASTRTSTAV